MAGAGMKNAEILDIMKKLIGAKNDSAFSNELEVDRALICLARQGKCRISKRVFLRFLIVSGMTADELVFSGVPYESIWG